MTDPQSQPPSPSPDIAILIFIPTSIPATRPDQQQQLAARVLKNLHLTVNNHIQAFRVPTAFIPEAHRQSGFMQPLHGTTTYEHDDEDAY